jgi:2-phosphosulfolactate phosphatase
MAWISLAGIWFSEPHPIVRSRKATRLLAASFCNVSATAKYIESHSPDKVTFVIASSRSGGWGDEDAACADYLEELLKDRDPGPESYLKRVRESTAGRLFTNSELDDFMLEDLEYCLAVDSFRFAMPTARQDERLIMIAQIT